MVDDRFNPWALDQALICFLAALCLHALIVAAALYWPANSRLKPNLSLPMLNLTQMTIGSKKAAPVEQNPPVQAAESAESKSEEVYTPVTPETLTPAVQENDPAPVPKIADLKPDIPAEQSKAVDIPKVEDTPKLDEPKPVEKPKPVERPKPAEKPKPASADVLRRALMQAEQDESKDLLAAALSSAKAEQDNDNPESSGTGDAYSEFLGDGVGVLASYRDSVISRIKPHFFTRPRNDGKIFEIWIILDIAENGNVTKVTVVKPSEDSTFEQNIMRAIKDAGVMEPPPNPEEQRLPIIFTSDMFAG
ncbi:MAG: TonB family protein [Deltaproteobacteria bacterium]|jgi:TonB family protein|nr:TonB family protein [Deltaproteobacteria bacterium]